MKLEVTNCDFKFIPVGWASLQAYGVHRTRCCHAVQRIQKAMMDADLAALYGVPTKVLNQAVSRNKQRFPSDFVFRLTKAETHELVTDCDRLHGLKHSSVFPQPFSEREVAMLPSVLNSKRAIQVNIAVMRTFLKVREILAAHKDLERSSKENSK